ncbi:MAG: hypothetical protein ACYCPD_04455 [Acidobacteriaceae bacterium]
MLALMALLKKIEKRPPKETLSVRLDPYLMELLDDYCNFIGNGRQDVVQSALAFIFEQDGDFKAWLKQHKLSKLAQKKGNL